MDKLPNSQNFFRADLHCHTTMSDGSLSPSEIIYAAIEHNLQALSITDHDNINAYQEALPLAKKLNFKLLSGIELSAYEDRQSVHVLGYAINLENKPLKQHAQNVIKYREERNSDILTKLKKYNIHIEYSELANRFPQSMLGRVHIAKMMVHKGYVKNLKVAFNDYLGDKGRCVSQLKALSVNDAIQMIHNAGGKAVLAHPHKIKKRKDLERIIEYPFDGIEAFHACSSPNQEQKIINIAKDKQWFITGGSDFHGSSHPYIKLGCSFTTQDTFDYLYGLCK